ncbi:unnamed protein product [Cuscuta campestris]|uniref:Uncharacterized protein n=1 Tax=Cuscuta campestris TaxID=132261 RepID=A0A484MIJ4_9ASTE|nr:unnamed protein product [Cuscuta campestris]
MFLETQLWLNSDVLQPTSLLEDLTPNHGFQLPKPDSAVGCTNIAVGLVWPDPCHVEPFKVAIHPVNFEVEPVEGVGNGGEVGPGLWFGWASGRGSMAWRGSSRRGVVRPLCEGLVADHSKLRGLHEWANDGGYLEPFKDVHHHERLREEVIVVGGRGDRHVDHDKLRPIDWGCVHDRVDELEVLTGHDCVAMLPRFDDPGHDVEDETAFGVCGVDALLGLLDSAVCMVPPDFMNGMTLAVLVLKMKDYLVGYFIIQGSTLEQDIEN